MRNLLTTATAVASLALGVSGHGAVTTPTPRKVRFNNPLPQSNASICPCVLTKNL